VDQELAYAAAQTLRVHSPGGSTFLREMTSRPPYSKCDANQKSDSTNRQILT